MADQRPDYVRCYLCGERRPKADTEVARYRVPSATMGGLVQGVHRYVRMCRVGYGCKGCTVPGCIDGITVSGETGEVTEVPCPGCGTYNANYSEKT